MQIASRCGYFARCRDWRNIPLRTEFEESVEKLAVTGIAAASGEELMPIDMTGTQDSVFHALLATRARFGGRRVALVDGDEREFSYDDILRASFALGHALKSGTR